MEKQEFYREQTYLMKSCKAKRHVAEQNNWPFDNIAFWFGGGKDCFAVLATITFL